MEKEMENDSDDEFPKPSQKRKRAGVSGIKKNVEKDDSDDESIKPTPLRKRTAVSGLTKKMFGKGDSDDEFPKPLSFIKRAGGSNDKKKKNVSDIFMESQDILDDSE